MNTLLRVAAATVLSTAFVGSAGAQPKTTLPPEPLPMGVPYVYQPGNNYWYAPALPASGAYGYVAVPPVRVVRHAPVVYPYPFASSGSIYGRYSWDYSGQYSAGYGWYATSLPHYPYSYQYPTAVGRVWMGYGW